MQIIQCPSCLTRMIPTREGVCPSCQYRPPSLADDTQQNADGASEQLQSDAFGRSAPFDAVRHVVLPNWRLKPASRELTQSGSYVVARHNAVFPKRCVKTNEPIDDADFVPMVFTYNPHGKWMSVFLPALNNWLSEVIVINVGLSKPWQRRRRFLLMLAYGLFAMSMMIGVALLALATMKSPLIFYFSKDPTMAAICFVLALKLPMLLSLIPFYFTQFVIIRRVTTTHLYLSGIHADFVASLPPYSRS